MTGVQTCALPIGRFYIALLKGQDKTTGKFIEQSFRYIDCTPLEKINLRRFFANPCFSFVQKKDLIDFCDSLMIFVLKLVLDYLKKALKQRGLVIKHSDIFLNDKNNFTTISLKIPFEQIIPQKSLIKLSQIYHVDVLNISTKKIQVMRLNFYI